MRLAEFSIASAAFTGPSHRVTCSNPNPQLPPALLTLFMPQVNPSSMFTTTSGPLRAPALSTGRLVDQATSTADMVSGTTLHSPTSGMSCRMDAGAAGLLPSREPLKASLPHLSLLPMLPL